MASNAHTQDDATLDLFPKWEVPPAMAPVQRKPRSKRFNEGLKPTLLDGVFYHRKTFNGKYFEPEDDDGKTAAYGPIQSVTAWDNELPRNLTIRKAKILEYIQELSDFLPPRLQNDPGKKTLREMADELSSDQASWLRALVAAGDEARYFGGNIQNPMEHRRRVYAEVDKKTYKTATDLVERLETLREAAEEHSTPRALAKAFEDDGPKNSNLQDYPAMCAFARDSIYMEHRRALKNKLQSIQRKYAQYTDAEFYDTAGPPNLSNEMELKIDDAISAYDKRIAHDDTKEMKAAIREFQKHPNRDFALTLLISSVSNPLYAFDTYFRKNLRLAYKEDRAAIRRDINAQWDIAYQEGEILPNPLENTCHTLDVLHYARWADAAKLTDKFMKNYAKTIRNPRYEAAGAKPAWLEEIERKTANAIARAGQPHKPTEDERWKQTIEKLVGKGGMEI
jgi:hypothetical protein